MSTENRSKTLLPISEVMRRTTRSRSYIYAQVPKGGFPKPISLGGRSVAWLEDDINAWIEDQITASRSTATRG